MKSKKYVYLVYNVWYNHERLLRVFKSLQSAKKFKTEQISLDMKGNEDLLLEDLLDEYLIKREEVH